MPYSGRFSKYIFCQNIKVLIRAQAVQRARRELMEHSCLSTIVWALADNDKAIAFYRRLGGLTVRRAEERLATICSAVAFGFASAPVR